MLSQTRVRAAKARNKRYRLTDANGLMLEVRPSRTKAWVMRYSFKGKRKNKTLGTYPTLSLRAARLNKYLFPSLGEREISAVTVADIRDLLLVIANYRFQADK